MAPATLRTTSSSKYSTMETILQDIANKYSINVEELYSNYLKKKMKSSSNSKEQQLQHEALENIPEFIEAYEEEYDGEPVLVDKNNIVYQYDHRGSIRIVGIKDLNTGEIRLLHDLLG